MSFSSADHQHMAQALRLAERGLFTTMPNPRVGCVLVRDGKVVGQGWHERAGQPHAEINALQQAGEAAQGATAYVTLEPCSHFGRTPPCSDALIRAGIRRVVAAIQDPNPQVAGSGLARLQAAGIETASGLMQAQAIELNRGFVSRMERGRPWVRSKIAASLDGKTALQNGVSQWITGVAARLDGQRWRARSCAILTGIGTVLQDDPQLNVRDLSIGRQPLRIVVDSHLQLSPSARILQGGQLFIVCGDHASTRAEALRAAGAEVMPLPGPDGRVDLKALMIELARREINELHVEAGAVLNGALLQLGLLDEMLVYLAPTLLGASARGMFEMPGLTEMAQSRKIEIVALDKVGEDIRIRALPR